MVSEPKLRILSKLVEQEMTYTQLKNEFQFSETAFLNHLKELAQAGLITKNEEGRYILTEAGRELLEKERVQSVASRLFSLFTRQVSPKNERIGKYLKGILQLSESAEKLAKSRFSLENDSYVVAYRRLGYLLATMALSTFILNTGDRLKVKSLRKISIPEFVSFFVSDEQRIQELQRIPQSIEELLSEMERDLHDDPEAMAFIDIVRGYTTIMSEDAKEIAAAFNK